MKSVLPSAIVILLAFYAASGAAGELFVSPSGDDTNPGTRERPLATIAAARDAARGIRDEAVTVYLGGGTYYLHEPVVFTPADSGTADTPVIYTAAPEQSPIISGGQRLKPNWQQYRDGVVRTDVPNGSTFDQLFVDGQRQHMARWPNYDVQSQYFQGFSAEATSPQRAARWNNPVGGFVHAMHRSLWGDMHWKITDKSTGGGLNLVGGWQNNRQMGAHKDYRFVENIFEELDAPSEWFLDIEQSVLYFFPPKDIDLDTARIEVVQLKHLIEFRGQQHDAVRHITLKGLTFTHTARTFMENKEPLLRSDWTTYRGGAILFDGGEDCAVRDCTIDQAGGNAVFINNYNRRIEITGCHIADAGASGVSFVGDPDALRSPLFEYHQAQTLEDMDQKPGPKSTNYPADSLVDNCLIYRNGRVEKQTAGVNICMAESITVRHCSIYECPRAGINICDGAFGGHVIEFCDVFDTVLETGDHGSFNSWGRDRFWHSNRDQTAEWVELNPDMPKWDCGKTIVLRNNRLRCDHGWDIDLDDGSSNYEISNNLCLAGGIKLREGYFRNVHNNILVDYTFCPHVWYPNSHSSFRHNILWQRKYATAGMTKTDQGAVIDNNIVHQAGATPRRANGLIEFGGDVSSIVADAMFIDPLAGDYRVRNDSPALKLGFENFAMDRFGVQKAELRAIAKMPPLPGTLEAARISSGGWGREYRTPKSAHWLGASLKEIEDQGEMSALGLGDRDGALVARVDDATVAHLAGLKQDDVIRSVNGAKIRTLKLFAEVWEKHATRGDVRLTLWRNQAEVSIVVPAQ